MTFAANLVEYLMVKSAAEFLGVSPSTLRNRDRAGKPSSPLCGWREKRGRDRHDREG